MLWDFLKGFGIREAPGGFEHVGAIPVAANEGRVKLDDGRVIPAVIVKFAVPIPDPAGKDGPPLTMEDVLDGAATVAHPGAFKAFLSEIRRKVGA